MPSDKDIIIWDATAGRWRYSPNGVVPFNTLQSSMAGDNQAYAVLQTPGGDTVASIWRVSSSCAGGGRSYTISSISTDTITITTTDARTIFDQITMNGVSYLRIWNTTKSPAESAWVKASPATNQVQVTDSSDISGWSATETIQVGDPTGSGFGNNYIAIDISPMQIALFGTAFRQSGILVKGGGPLGATSGDDIALTPDGSNGSLVTATKDIGGITTSICTTFIPTTELSPISNSNLVLIRDKIATTATIRLITSLALTV